MQIKQFKAQDMTAALAQIKKEFGPDAVILSARDIRQRKGLLGMPRISGVEVTAAIDLARPQVQGDVRPATVPRDTVEDVVRIGLKKGFMRSLQSGMSVFQKRGEAMTGKQPSDPVRRSAEGERLTGRLTAQGVRPDVASKLGDQMRVLSSAGTAGDRVMGRDGLAGVLAALGLAVETANPVEGDRVTVLAGPTGTGKTTVLAKLAATRRAAGLRVGLITLDQQRIGAVAQLRVYADILGLSLEMAADAGELTAALARLADCDSILIDTPGLSPKSAFQIHALKSTLAVAEPARTLLVLSATTKDEDLDQALERYRILGIDALVFTRLDESLRFGNLINSAVAADLPVAYLCSGVQVPDDLETATAGRLADLLFGPDVSKSARISRSPARPRSKDVQRPVAVAAEREPVPPVCPPESARFVANCNSNIFHRPDCKWTRIIKQDNMVVFRSVEEARAQKFSPCRYCTPVTVEAFRPIRQTIEKQLAGGIR